MWFCGGKQNYTSPSGALQKLVLPYHARPSMNSKAIHKLLKYFKQDSMTQFQDVSHIHSVQLKSLSTYTHNSIH
jgi:hypothetical protein